MEAQRNAKVKRQPKPQTIVVDSIDYTILVCTILLVLIGLIMIFSSSYYVASISSRFNYNMYQPIKSQVSVAILGFILLIIVANINYKIYGAFGKISYVIVIGLLVYTSIFGIKVYNARRWIPVPFIGRFQPSEVAKIAIMLCFGQMIQNDSKNVDTFKGLFKLGAMLGLCALIVYKGNSDLSTALVIVAIGGAIIFVSSKYTKTLTLLALAAVTIMVFGLSMSSGFRGDRFDAWRDPFNYASSIGLQTVQSLYAIASGGLFGVGLGQSRQKLGFLPEAHNDIIFSIICEELGIFGAGLVLFLYGVLLWRIIKVAKDCPDTFGSLVATGVATMIGVQVIINIAVATNTIPNTGIPLPFISHGGTSLLVMLISIGMVLSISRYSRKPL